MTVSDLRTNLRNLAEMYFRGATVKFANQSFTPKPDAPLLQLTMGSVNRPLNPPVKIIDGQPVAYYPASTMVQIDLFTNGRQKEIAPGFTPIAENTAEDDLLAFASFLNSEYVVQWCHSRDIALIVPPTVQDLTGLINDTNYEFRAMLEATVYFTMTAIGYTGTLDPESVKHQVIGPDGRPVIGADGKPVLVPEGSTVAGPDDPTVMKPDGTPVTDQSGDPLQIGSGDIISDGVAAYEPVITQTPSGGGSEELAAHEGDYFSNVEINQKLVKEENNQ